MEAKTSDNNAEFWNDLTSGKFESLVRESSRDQAVANSGELYNILKPLYAREPDVEKCYFVFLDAKNHIISIDCMFTGSLTSSAVYPREVLKKILYHQAAAITMAHNHPSGDAEPSDDDYYITSCIILACHCIGVTVHEHMIIGCEGRYHSMSDQGTISCIRRGAAEAVKRNFYRR